jgi:RHS repeat-associated protein
VRTGTIEVLDAASNAVLDTRSLSSYANGKYLVWELSGHVKLKFTDLSPTGWNEVVSGLFFDPLGNRAIFKTTDTTTQGNWKGVYGADGYNVINDAASYPSYATVSVTGQSAYTWAASTTDTRAPLKAASTTDRLASCWYSSTNFTIDVNLTDGNAHRVAVYALDWNSNNVRTGTVEVLDAASNAVLDTRSLSSYANGKYLVWELSGHVKLRFTDLSPTGWNEVVSGLFFDPVGSGGSSAANINWLVTDQLGTPRMMFDQSGALATTKRHDYAPFGEELLNGARSTALGYAANDSTRQKFTQKERDNETGLDYFGARYYSSVQGRFANVDPYNIVREAQVTAQSNPNKAAVQLERYLSAPEQWNRYAYAANNPLKYIDPTGQRIELTGSTQADRDEALTRLKILVGKEGAKHLSMQEEKGHYYVKSDVNLCDVSGPNDSSTLNYYMSELIDRKDHTVEYKIADSFTTLNETRTTAGDRCGGACTVGAEESTTHNTQIFVNRNASVYAEQSFRKLINSSSGKYSGGQPSFEEDIVDAHEFGHAYANAIEGKQLHNSDATNERARGWENLQRATYPYPARRMRE